MLVDWVNFGSIKCLYNEGWKIDFYFVFLLLDIKKYDV